MAALPRILRLLVAGELTGGFLDTLPLRFVEAGWPNWPARERAMVDDLLPSLWHTTLSEYPSASNAHELLTFRTQMTRDPRPWLAVWSAIGGVPAARQLADFMTRCYHFTWGLLTDFDEDAVEEEILRWLVRDGRAILAALDGAELDAASERFAR